MNIQRSTRIGPSVVLLALGAFGALAVDDVLADGIPEVAPLVYSGLITQGGQPVPDGERSITLRLWPTAEREGQPLCTTVNAADVVDGRFSIPLHESCKAVVNENPELYIEVVDGSRSLGSHKLSAVPYAIEAEHAQRAARADGVERLGDLIQSGAVVASVNTANCTEGAWALYSGTEDRRCTVHVDFESAFERVPTVHHGLTHFDTSKDHNARLRVTTENVTEAGFDLVFFTWSDTLVHGATVNWMAYLP